MRSFYNMRSDFRRLFGLSVLILFAASATGQTVSPYSIFGNGERESGKLANQLGMGGISTGLRDPLQINISQPASYSSLLYTTIEIGGFYQETFLNDGAQQVQTNSGGFNYLSLGFPLGEKLGMSIGLLPYSKVGYDIEARTSTPFSDANVQYSGEGGFDRAYFGLGWELYKGLSVGANGSYYFGSSERLTTVLFDNTNFYHITREENILASGFSWDAGVQYQMNFSGDRDLILGATFTPKTTMSGEVNDLQYTFTQNASGTRFYNDTVYSTQAKNVNVVFNSNYSFGFTFGGRHEQLVQHAWSFGAGYKLMNRDELTASTEIRGEYQQGFRANIGGQMIPYYTFDMNRGNYFSQIDYRLGAFYENTGLVVGGEAINDFGGTIGLGLPIGRRTQAPGDVKLATLNIGMIVGRRGTEASGNISETYTRFVVGLTLNDKWFTQFKYR
ncbi:membrane protein [Phaeocystidibacter marisrubri]|nr:membrane protein [Phaeocystidibacter marisrubri]